MPWSPLQMILTWIHLNARKCASNVNRESLYAPTSVRTVPVSVWSVTHVEPFRKCAPEVPLPFWEITRRSPNCWTNSKERRIPLKNIEEQEGTKDLPKWRDFSLWTRQTTNPDINPNSNHQARIRYFSANPSKKDSSLSGLGVNSHIQMEGSGSGKQFNSSRTYLEC